MSSVNHEKFYTWLYLPFEADVEEIIKYYHTQPISELIFATKLVYYCKKFMELSLEETEAFLADNGFSLTDLLNAYKLEYPEPTVYSKSAMKVCSPPPVHVFHDKYPEVDPELGRARISHLRCRHTTCSFVAETNNEMRDHLRERQCYTPYFHTMHENAIAALRLTPEKVVAEGLNFCPSPICDRKGETMTPEDLCEHLTLLGIEPFWQPGMQFDYLSELPKLEIKSSMPIYRSKKCLYCYEKKPSVLFMNCNHNICCFKCFHKIKDKRCPVCYTGIKHTIAY